MKVSKNELIRAGMDLRRVINTPSFALAIDILKSDYTNRMVSSEYGDTSGRETAYKQLVALDDLIGVILTLAGQAEADALNNEPQE
jgi:hypothetical protein